MNDYSNVSAALARGADPAMLCTTCPWDRYCINPPAMTRADIDAQIEKASEEDRKRAEQAKAAGKEPGMPVGGLLMALTVGGRDQTATICPVLAMRLRASAGRGIADSLKASMQGWDDQAVTS